MQAANKYDAVIGLEVHALQNTLSKVFSDDLNSFGTEPNQNVSVISLGHPGSLPGLNAKVIEYALKPGLATKSTISPNVSFAREMDLLKESGENIIMKHVEEALDKYPGTGK